MYLLRVNILQFSTIGEYLVDREGLHNNVIGNICILCAIIYTYTK